MRKIKQIVTAIALLVNIQAQAQQKDSSAIVSYIRLYKDIAIEEMKRSGIPASITLGQGIHESSFGTSYLAQNTNNHFGIKCKETWTGKTFKYTDDAPNECFRVYDNVTQSYKDHTDFLTGRSRYAALFMLDKNDYKGWAMGLKKAGYATNPKYADILIKTIEDYQLYLFDRNENPNYILPKQNKPIVETDDGENYNVMDSLEVENNNLIPQTVSTKPVTEVKVPVLPKPDFTKPVNKKITKVNNVNSVKLNKGETIDLIANVLKIEKTDLLLFNDITEEGMVKEGDLLFLAQKKKNNKEGTYKMKTDDNMWRIAQKKGIRLSSLLKMNKLEAGEEPVAKTSICLKGKVKEKPELRKINEIKKDTVKTITKSIVRANDTVYPSIKEPLKSTVDSSKLLPWESDTKLLEEKKAVVYPKKDTIVKIVKQDEKEAAVEEEFSTKPIVNIAEKTVYPAVTEYDKLPKSSSGKHLVVKGDTMYNISKRYNISITEIMEWNNLSDQSVKLGQVLKIQP